MARRELRSHVADCALGLFTAAGYGPTTVREVATAAAVTPASIYHRFKTKDGLLTEAVAPLVADLESVVAAPAGSQGRPTEDDRIRLIRGYLLSLLRHRDAAQLLLYDQSARGTTACEEVTDQHRRLVSLLVGPRASIQRQVRARCAVAIAQLAAGELKAVPPHRLRRPLVEAAIDTLMGFDVLTERGASAQEDLIDLREDGDEFPAGAAAAEDLVHGIDR